MSISRRQFVGSATALAAGLTVPALYSGPAFAQPKKGGHFRMGKAHGQTTDTLNPATWENGFTIALGYAVHGYLTEVGADGTVKPHLAESWESSPDAKQWTLKLRKGVTYHSGKPLTTDDVIIALNHHRGAESTSAAGPIVAEIENIRADGDDAVIFELAAGNADFPFTLTDYHLPIPPSKDGEIDWKSGDGCGCYRLERFEPGVAANLVRYEDHWADDRGFFDSIEMLAVIDTNARTSALMSGNVDAIDRVDLKTVELLKRNQALNIHSVAGTQHYTFAMSCKTDPFTDNNIRLALKHGIDRQALVDKILRGYGVLGNDHPIGQGQRFYNEDLAQTAYDPDKAKSFLDKAGVSSLKVKLSASDAAFSGAVDAAVLFQSSAKPAGIEIEVVREPSDGYWSDVWMKKPFVAVYWGGRPTEDAMFTTTYKTGASWNDTFWSNQQFDELLKMARAELDEDKRRAMYYEMQAIVNHDGGAIIPMFANYVFATTDQVGYSEPFATNWDLDGERWAERWWFA